MATPFRVLADAGIKMAGTRSRRRLRELVAELLRAVELDEIAETTRLLIGQAFPAAENRALRISGAAVWRALEPIFGQPQSALQSYTAGAVDFPAGIREVFSRLPKQPDICSDTQEALTIADVYTALSQIAALGGSGARTDKEIVLRELLCRADADEALFIVKNVIGEMRHGVNQGMLLEGIAHAIGADSALVQQSFMLIGDLGTLASLALTEGVAALEDLEVTLFTPLRPMLAQTADDVSAAWTRHGGHLALEYKLDGARVQIHKHGDDVRMYSRHLLEVTASLPEVAEDVRKHVSAENAILEGEVVAVDAQNKTLPFQELMRRFRRIHAVPTLLHAVPVRLYLFDCLYAVDESLLDLPNAERWTRLTALVHPTERLQLVPRCLPATVEEGSAFFNQAIDQGHEGLMAKRLDSRYQPGVRGAGWLKIKEAMTVDLVITAAEWGYGRRTGWLSNYHLAARDISTGELVLVGKTFKGLTDQEFQEMTNALMELRVGPETHVVAVCPQIVVEVAFNQLQRSPSYPGGLSLRFARIVRFRTEKGVDDIDTLQTLRDIYTMQTGQPWADAA